MMMRCRLTILALVIGLALNASGNVWAAEQESEEYLKDSAAGIEGQYAKHYLVAKATMSPDEKFAVIYPTLEFSESNEQRTSWSRSNRSRCWQRFQPMNRISRTKATVELGRSGPETVARR